MNFITRDELYTSSDIKEEAKAQLQGNWRSAIFLSMIPVLFSILFVNNSREVVMNNIPSAIEATNIILNTVQGFLSMGVMYTFMDFVRNRDNGYVIEPLRGVIQPFRLEYFLNLLLLKLLKYLYIILWSLLLIIPGIIKAYEYSQAEKIYKDKVDSTGEQPLAKECIKESQRLMKGNKLSLFTLNLSFIGWHLLAIFSYGIGYIWLTPYTTMSDVIFFENISDERYRNIDLNDERLFEERDLTPPTEEIGKDPDDFSDFEDF